MKMRVCAREIKDLRAAPIFMLRGAPEARAACRKVFWVIRGGVGLTRRRGAKLQHTERLMGVSILALDFPRAGPDCYLRGFPSQLAGKIVRLHQTDLESYPAKGERIGFILHEQSPLSTRSERTSGLAVSDAVGRETPEEAGCSSSSF